MDWILTGDTNTDYPIRIITKYFIRNEAIPIWFFQVKSCIAHTYIANMLMYYACTSIYLNFTFFP